MPMATGRVTLLGGALHNMPSFRGIGASIGIRLAFAIVWVGVLPIARFPPGPVAPVQDVCSAVLRSGLSSILGFSDVRPAGPDVGATRVVASGRSWALFPYGVHHSRIARAPL